jgi:DNA-binding NtrC family response regulator
MHVTGNNLHNSAVLIVDDDSDVRHLFAMILSGAGFPIRLAANGVEAVDVYTRHRAEIGLVLLDVRMPVQDGPSTLAELLRLDPDVRCCFLSGNTGRYAPAELMALGAAGFVGKPFRNDDLLAIVHQLARSTKNSGDRELLTALNGSIPCNSDIAASLNELAVRDLA